MHENTEVVDKLCPICGKNFIPAGLHSYKDARTGNLVCTYPCELKSKRMKEAQSDELKYMTKRIAVTKKALTDATAKPKFNAGEIHKLQERLAVEKSIYNIILEHEETMAAYAQDEEEN